MPTSMGFLIFVLIDAVGLVILLSYGHTLLVIFGNILKNFFKNRFVWKSPREAGNSRNVLTTESIKICAKKYDNRRANIKGKLQNMLSYMREEILEFCPQNVLILKKTHKYVCFK